MAKPSYEILLAALSTAVTLIEVQRKHPEMEISAAALKSLNEIIKDSKSKELNV